MSAIQDSVPSRSVPVVTRALILVNAVVFFCELCFLGRASNKSALAHHSLKKQACYFVYRTAISILITESVETYSRESAFFDNDVLQPKEPGFTGTAISGIPWLESDADVSFGMFV